MYSSDMATVETKRDELKNAASEIDLPTIWAKVEELSRVKR